MPMRHRAPRRRPGTSRLMADRRSSGVLWRLMKHRGSCASAAYPAAADQRYCAASMMSRSRRLGASSPAGRAGGRAAFQPAFAERASAVKHSYWSAGEMVARCGADRLHLDGAGGGTDSDHVGSCDGNTRPPGQSSSCSLGVTVMTWNPRRGAKGRQPFGRPQPGSSLHYPAAGAAAGPFRVTAEPARPLRTSAPPAIPGAQRSGSAAWSIPAPQGIFRKSLRFYWMYHGRVLTL